MPMPQPLVVTELRQQHAASGPAQSNESDFQWRRPGIGELRRAGVQRQRPGQRAEGRQPIRGQRPGARSRDPNTQGPRRKTPTNGVAWGWHGVGMGLACVGLAWGWHGVGMGLAWGLAWGWHGASMGLAAGMGWNGVGMCRMGPRDGDGPTGPRAPGRRRSGAVQRQRASCPPLGAGCLLVLSA
jgi:hypothetical protein